MSKIRKVSPRVSKPTIYVLSDSLGETAEVVSKAAASQFEEEFELVKVPKVSDKEDIKRIVGKARDGNCVLFYTLVKPKLRKFLEEQADEASIPRLDILSPAIEALITISKTSPRLEVGAGHRVNRDYFHRIEALNFAVKHDDGRNARDLRKADVVLIGVSRTSKTPLAMYLAYRGWKVANIPIVLGIEPPRELFEISPQKIIGLTIDADFLTSVREQRLGSLGSPRNGYVEKRDILRELDFAESVMKRIGCKVINVTHRAVEETASEILRYYS
ncbi:MAG: pyruvate, water dikinase regulatory protein [Actinomycetota bacterium]|nr:pyruvate, water dikinase regulatory protein [Actinomycetota bacterium]